MSNSPLGKCYILGCEGPVKYKSQIKSLQSRIAELEGLLEWHNFKGYTHPPRSIPLLVKVNDRPYVAINRGNLAWEIQCLHSNNVIELSESMIDEWRYITPPSAQEGGKE